MSFVPSQQLGIFPTVRVAGPDLDLNQIPPE
jgi:hypothetical protein